MVVSDILRERVSALGPEGAKSFCRGDLPLGVGTLAVKRFRSAVTHALAAVASVGFSEPSPCGWLL